MEYLKYLFIIIAIYLVLDILEYIILKYVKKIEFKNYFYYLINKNKVLKNKTKDKSKNEN